MGLISKPKTWADSDKVNFNDLNDNFDTMYTEFNGGIDNNNLDASAAIDKTKISGTAVTLTDTQTITGPKTFYKTVQTIITATDGATVTFDMSTGNIQKVTLGGNRTLALSNISTGQCFIVMLVQDGTGSRTVTWFAGIAWPGGVTPTLTTTASKTDIFGVICTGTNTYVGSIIGQNL